MDKKLLLEVLIDQKEVFQSKSGLIARDYPLDSYLKTSQVVVITGVRRSGKSSLMFLIKEALKLSEGEFCYCNFDDERIMPYPQLFNDIYSLHLETYRSEPIFFFDEIQEAPGWEKFVNRMYEQGRKVFVTGSNATLLSSEISTSLTGRNKVLELFPFSFSEYLRMEGKSYNIERLSVKKRSMLLNELSTFLETGGFPLVAKEKDAEIAHALFQDILYRDIVVRYKLSNIAEVKQIALFLASNIGKVFSYASLQHVAGVKSLSSVKNYLQYYEASYLFYYLRKFDYSVKKQIMNSRKVYAIDNAIPNRLGFRFSGNKGRLLENIVFLDLKRRGRELYYFSGKYECDFLIKENLQITEAVQVTYMLDAENVKREIGGLKEAMSVFNIPKGTLIVFDENNYAAEVPENISIVPAFKWLLG
ncbi:ATP-binding protein [Haoranjiania flava]|uniref:ATP-binding protein n=1 Tax=Haoranjiania flava TaxID=1856322 RepID=A0AAE3LKB0_9BACT|nr:ATP-binding protein [Haoranjiania flava]MCU7694632.1 ATP-binding protein [Haoranjiania flava]